MTDFTHRLQHATYSQSTDNQFKHYATESRFGKDLVPTKDKLPTLDEFRQICAHALVRVRLASAVESALHNNACGGPQSGSHHVEALRNIYNSFWRQPDYNRILRRIGFKFNGTTFFAAKAVGKLHAIGALADRHLRAVDEASLAIDRRVNELAEISRQSSGLSANERKFASTARAELVKVRGEIHDQLMKDIQAVPGVRQRLAAASVIKVKKTVRFAPTPSIREYEVGSAVRPKTVTTGKAGSRARVASSASSRTSPYAHEYGSTYEAGTRAQAVVVKGQSVTPVDGAQKSTEVGRGFAYPSQDKYGNFTAS